MIEELRETRIPPLGHARRHLRRLLFFRVVVDVEVVGLQYLELELPVLDLVLTKVAPLGKGSRRQPQQRAQGCHNEGAGNFHDDLAKATHVPVKPCGFTAYVLSSSSQTIFFDQN